MSLATDPSRRASLVERVQGIILRPATEWDRIDVEPATTQGLFTGYAMVLAAIGPICSAIGMVVFGVGIPGIATYHASPIGAVVSAIVSYVMMLAAVFVVGLIIDALAPTFGGQKNQVQAMKVAVYGSTASWVAGVFGLIPMLAVLGVIGGLYSLYLYYVGLPKLMKAPQDKALGYTALVVVCAIVLFLVIGLVTAPLRMIGAAGMGVGGVTTLGDAGGTVRVGGGAVNLAALSAASKASEAQAAAIQAQAAQASTTGAVVAGAATASADALKALLPGAINGFVRGDVSAESGGAGGLNTSHAQAEYSRGDGRFTVEVTDTGGMAALGGLAAAMGVNGTKETATGYEKVSTSGGRMTTETYDRQDRSGKFSVMAGRALVAAEGRNVSMDDLKAAVAAVDPGRVSSIAHS